MTTKPDRQEGDGLCDDCPPVSYSTDKTSCGSCPRRATPQPRDAAEETRADVKSEVEYFEQHADRFAEAHRGLVAPPKPAPDAMREASRSMLIAGARSIGNTINESNHMQRAKACWQAMNDAEHGIEEPKPQNPSAPVPPADGALPSILLDINAVHWSALRLVIEWWDGLPPNLRQDIEGSGKEPGAIAAARSALPYIPSGAGAAEPDPFKELVGTLENLELNSFDDEKSADARDRLAEAKLSAKTALRATPPVRGDREAKAAQETLDWFDHFEFKDSHLIFSDYEQRHITRFCVGDLRALLSLLIQPVAINREAIARALVKRRWPARPDSYIEEQFKWYATLDTTNTNSWSNTTQGHWATIDDAYADADAVLRAQPGLNDRAKQIFYAVLTKYYPKDATVDAAYQDFSEALRDAK